MLLHFSFRAGTGTASIPLSRGKALMCYFQPGPKAEVQPCPHTRGPGLSLPSNLGTVIMSRRPHGTRLQSEAVRKVMPFPLGGPSVCGRSG